MTCDLVESLSISIEQCLNTTRNRTILFLSYDKMIVIWHETVSRQRDRVSFDVLVKQTDTIEVISGIQDQSFLVSPPIVHMVGFPICEFQHVPPKYELHLGKVITLPRCLTS